MALASGRGQTCEPTPRDNLLVDAEIMIFAATSITGWLGAAVGGWKAHQARKTDLRSDMVKDLYEILNLHRNLLAEEREARAHMEARLAQCEQDCKAKIEAVELELTEERSKVAAMRGECPRFRGLQCELR